MFLYYQALDTPHHHFFYHHILYRYYHYYCHSQPGSRRHSVLEDLSHYPVWKIYYFRLPWDLRDTSPFGKKYACSAPYSISWVTEISVAFSTLLLSNPVIAVFIPEFKSVWYSYF